MAESNPLSPSADAASADRRRSPRLSVQNRILGRLLPKGTPIRVLDIGFGGFLIEAESDFDVGALQQIRLYSMDGSADVVVTGRVVHSRRDSAAARHSRFVTGFALVGPHGWDAHAQFDRLLEIVSEETSGS